MQHGLEGVIAKRSDKDLIYAAKVRTGFIQKRRRRSLLMWPATYD
jgi:hypothetical protein